MMKTIKQIFLASALFLTTALGLSAHANSAVIFSFDNDTIDVGVGETVVLNLLATTETPSDAITNFFLEAYFDASGLSLDSIVLNPAFAIPLAGTANQFGGAISFPFGTPVGGNNVVIATFSLTALLADTFTFGINEATPAVGTSVSGASFAPVDFTPASAQITVESVSAPSMLAAFALVLGVAAIRRKA